MGVSGHRRICCKVSDQAWFHCCMVPLWDMVSSHYSDAVCRGAPALVGAGAGVQSTDAHGGGQGSSNSSIVCELSHFIEELPARNASTWQGFLPRCASIKKEISAAGLYIQLKMSSHGAAMVCLAVQSCRQSLRVVLLLHTGWGILIIALACVAGLVLIGFLGMLLVQQYRSSRTGSFARCAIFSHAFAA